MLRYLRAPLAPLPFFPSFLPFLSLLEPFLEYLPSGGVGATARLSESLPLHPRLESQLPVSIPSYAMYTWYERLQDWRRRSLSSWDGTGVVRSFGGAATTISRKTLFAALACFCTVALFVSRRSLSESLPHELSKAEAAGKVESASDKEGGDLGSPCALRLRTCFSESFLDVRSSTPATSTTETFRRIAFEHPRCGDCLIVHLLAKTGNVGLEVFLPSKATEEVTREDELAIERIGVHGKDWERVEYKHWTGSRCVNSKSCESSISLDPTLY